MAHTFRKIDICFVFFFSGVSDDAGESYSASQPQTMLLAPRAENTKAHGKSQFHNTFEIFSKKAASLPLLRAKHSPPAQPTNRTNTHAKISKISTNLAVETQEHEAIT